MSMTYHPMFFQTKLAASFHNVNAIKDRLSILEKQNSAVSREVSHLILEKQPQYQRELENVLLLQEENEDAYDSCIRARRYTFYSFCTAVELSRVCPSILWSHTHWLLETVVVASVYRVFEMFSIVFKHSIIIPTYLIGL